MSLTRTTTVSLRGGSVNAKVIHKSGGDVQVRLGLPGGTEFVCRTNYATTKSDISKFLRAIADVVEYPAPEDNI